MVSEDYVSFEVAKLLKEKDFDGSCFAAYNGNGKLYKFDEEADDNVPYWSDAPTLQMAMKWLREIHNISVEPLVDFGSGNRYWWTADIGYIKKSGLITELCGYNSYEQAAEAAIKYCLTNLI